MRVAVSGTYGVGKSTLARVLAERMEMPLVGARGMRDFLAEHFPGKTLIECEPAELIELGLRRFEERVATEAVAGSCFVSDGSTLNEWAYGHGRRELGIHPTDSAIREAPAVRRVEFDLMLAHMGRVFRDHAARSYDLIIHLPIEFSLSSDGHRPVSAGYRRLTNDLLELAPTELGVRIIRVGGSVEERAAATIHAIRGGR